MTGGEAEMEYLPRLCAARVVQPFPPQSFCECRSAIVIKEKCIYFLQKQGKTSAKHQISVLI